MTQRKRHPGPLDRFLWGAATSAFQLEGAPACDWTGWRIRDEEDRLARLRGVGHLDRTDDDLDLLSVLGANAYRFSVEWSRIFPEEGTVDRVALDRYVRIASTLRDRGIEPMVTLHHFTHPSWFAGWTSPSGRGEFLRFAEEVVRALTPSTRLFVTFNEPNVLVAGGWIAGVMPPGRKDAKEAGRVYASILSTHVDLYDLIHAEVDGAAVGLAHNMVDFHPATPLSQLDRFAVKASHSVYNLALLESFRTGYLRLRLPILEEEFPVGTRDKLDFLGVNYYFRLFMRLSPLCLAGPEPLHEDRSGRGLTQTGWEVWPKGFETVLKTATLAGVPIVVTENGTAESDDDRKIAYLRDHLKVLKKVAREGVDVRGYFCWSLLDNYEWLEGLKPRFGLFRVDPETLRREPTEAAAWYARHIRENPDPRIP